MSDHRSRPLRFSRTDTDCFVITSHRLNADGYFRKCWGSKSQKTGILEMFHRFIYRAHAGLEAIPNGYEVDHMCKNRACCNPAHLRLLEGSAHAIVSNQQRYAARHSTAYRHWKETGCTGTALAAHVGVSFGQGCRWIRQWRSSLS